MVDCKQGQPILPDNLEYPDKTSDVINYNYCVYAAHYRSNIQLMQFVLRTLSGMIFDLQK